MQYNAAFFGTHEAYFLILKELKGEKFALDATGKVMKRGLGKAYDSTGFVKGSPKDFVRVVGERDRSVGLKVKFPAVSDNKIVYQFHTDPFPNLKGKVKPGNLDATYMDFKVNYLLGKDWKYKTTKHIWKGDEYTEHVIEKC
ncbi:hypothetical protein HYZ41_03615 [archaeon]|nr:hypothetical protein [archaeon]